MESGEPVPGSLYIYAPNKGAPFFFVVAYAISAIGHIWQCCRYRSWGLLGLHPFCGIMFTAGYVLRAYGAFNYIYNDSALLVYILSQVFIYICPPLLELANYHVLGRILYYVPYFAPLPPGRVLAIFGGLMAIVECLNALGVAFSADPLGSPQKQTLGKGLILAALCTQLIVIFVFVVLAGIFHHRCKKAKVNTRAVSTPLVVLYASMGLILVRCIYRLAEHAGNAEVELGDFESLRNLSPILRYEWYFYFFEATLMLINSAIWNIWHPGRFLPRDYHIHLSPNGRTEIKSREEPDDRSLAAKVVHILTLGLLFGRKRSNLTSEELAIYPAVNGDQS